MRGSLLKHITHCNIDGTLSLNCVEIQGSVGSGTLESSTFVLAMAGFKARACLLVLHDV